VLDKTNRLWVWSAASPHGDDSLKLQGLPQLAEGLNKHRIRHVFMGSQYVFAMGDDVGEIVAPKEQPVL
jgi:hypothetical protein